MKDTNWTKWSSIAEIFSAIAILFTLLYLALQTKYIAEQTELNSRAIQASAIQSLIERDMANTDLLIADPEILFLIMNKNEMTDLETGKLYSFMTSITRSRESYFRQYSLGVIDKELYESLENPYLFILSIEHINNYWQRSKTQLDSKFVSRIDSQLKNREITNGAAEVVTNMFDPL